ncbi:DcaP family trimeric outer membrane transporter [Pseudoalteromonas sp. TB64]|uniref:DcaP family trimeric outer membrane transporter n=1 Tax=Pseudoalteromonas sp. TB64 TaxID=1938600 RepID=UPI000414C4FD|nr:DcaP family trimeric outer membrane transporter [Pseudoalteromonas sp. TB64]
MTHTKPHLISAALSIILLGYSNLSLASIELANIDTGSKKTKVELGGYAKVDVRHVSGDIAYQDYWIGNFPEGEAVDTSHTGFNVKESRLNLKIQRGDVIGFVEVDFYGGGGNEVVSNSSNDRLRHFYIQYKDWLAGQTWSTFMPLAALPETLDFGGPHVGEVFIRQTQIRYSHGGWQFAIENPETNGDGDNGTASSAVGVSGAQADKDESIPDFVARYNYKKEWGELSIGALLRKVDQGGIDKTALAGNFSGKIKTFGKDDFRFQVSVGEPGRYAAAGLTNDIVVNERDEVEVEKTTAFTVAYKHFWTGAWRSTAFYGAAKTDIIEKDRAHWGVNLITNITDDLNAGIELGQYKINDENIDSISSNYFQLSAKYSF